MRPYSPSGKISLIPFLFSLILGVLFAVIIGVVFSLFSNLVVYLVPVSMIVVAALSLAIARIVTMIGRNRSAALAAIVGLLLGVAIYGTSKVADYGYALYLRESQGNNKSDIIENIRLAVQPQNVAAFDLLLNREVGQGGVIGFVLLQAEEGMSISRISSTSSGGGIELNRDLTLGYWGIELLIIAIAGAAGAVGAARMPYDEVNKRWLKENGWKFFGTVPEGYQTQFVEALKAGNWQLAGQLMVPGVSGSSIRVEAVKTGEDLTSDVVLRVKQQAKRSNFETHGLLSMNEFKLLLDHSQRMHQQRMAGSQIPSY